ncbi:hypothetical protein F4678DRAFT_484953 [Xylaria arbuscula]|nr:hypothetical protein F4678DRAFT_484953 [Xylaria arbuscula]
MVGLYQYSKDAPSSPWAERYPYNGILYASENVNHSILAPEYPRINDPKYYDTYGPPTDEQIPRTDEEVDKVLGGEKVQKVELYNLQTWQASVLRRHLRFSPSTGFMSGGHRPVDGQKTELPFFSLPPRRLRSSLPGLPSRTWSINMGPNEERQLQVYTRERIKVDETKWFSFFRKERWFDWQEFRPDLTGLPERTWSVDDPEIWEHLSISIEVADRMLKALVHDKHEGVSDMTTSPGVLQADYYRTNIHQLQTTIFGRWDYWDKHADHFGPPPSKDASILLSLPLEQLLSQKRGESSCSWDRILKYSKNGWTKRLEKLLNTLIWSFAGMERKVEALTAGTPYVDESHNSPYGAVIMLHIANLKTLMKSDLTLEERCTVLVTQSVSIVHELMHALLCCRYHKDNYRGNMLNPNRSGRTPDEPFVDGEGFCEMGHYMESKFFGGGLARSPLQSEDDRSPIPLAMISYKYPWCFPAYKTVPNAAFVKDGYVGEVDHVASTWFSKMLGESFWQDPAIPFKSKNFFHRNGIVSAKYIIKNEDRIFGDELTVADPASLTPYNYPEDEVLLSDLRERDYQWLVYRMSWHLMKNLDWQSTPWSDMPARKTIGDFVASFRAKDLLSCHKIATSLRERFNDMDFDHFKDNMPVYSHNKTDYTWMWYCIGHLMEASLPISLRNVQRLNQNPYVWAHELLPSRKSGAAGNAEVVHVYATGGGLGQRVDINYQRRELTNYIRSSQKKDFSQFDYLDLVDDVVKLVIANGAVVSSSLMRAIQTASAALRTEREAIQAGYGKASRTRWASDWFFEFPEYDPTLLQWGDGGWTTYNS